MRWSAEISRWRPASQCTWEASGRGRHRLSVGTEHVANVAWWRTWDNAADALLTDASYAAGAAGCSTPRPS